MSGQTPRKANPFSEQGVSRYPPVAPLVGQLEVYQRLDDMVDVMREEEGSCFRAIYGDWGIGKTRLAHELVAEACGKSKGWILRGHDGQVRRHRLLPPLQEGGMLPVFTTFADVLQTPEAGINMRTALPKAACVALVGLAQQRGRDFQVRMASDLQQAIRSINPEFDFEELSHLARNPDVALEERAKQAFAFLQEATRLGGTPGVLDLLVIIDEIETPGEYTSANTAEERRVQEYPVEAMDIKALFSAVKEEAGQATLPHIRFLLLCSPGVRRVSYIEASARRLKDAELVKATGFELDLLLETLQAEGYFRSLPGDLARAAFLAAGRNFGWFSYIMNPVYRLIQEGEAEGEDYDVLRQVSGRIGKVFKSQLIEDLSIPEELKEPLRRVVYHQLAATPRHLGIADAALGRLKGYIDPYGIRVVGEVHSVQIDGDTLIRELLATGRYREETANSTNLIGEASTPFDPRELLGQFSTFQAPESNAILVFADLSDFASQVRFLSPKDLTDATIGSLHGIFERHRLSDDPAQIGPTVKFLLKFNERWAAAGGQAWLPDPLWEKQEKGLKELSTTEVRQRVCLGVAKTLYDPLPTRQTIPGMSGAYLALKLSEADNLSVTRESALMILYANDAATAVTDLSTAARRLRTPVLLIFPNEETLRKWRHELDVSHASVLGVLAIPRVIDVGGREHEFILRYAGRDEDSGFPSQEVRDRGKDQRSEYEREWRRAIDGWFARLEEQGYLLRPVCDQNRYDRFLQAYGHLAAGKTKDQLAALAVDGANQMRQTVDTVLAQLDSGNVLRTLADSSGVLCFPNVFARILDLLTTPRRDEDLAGELVYRRTATAGFNPPRPPVAAVKQVLGLLERLGLVQRMEDGTYAAVDSQRLAALLTRAKNQLGDFGSPPSNFVKAVRELSPPFQQLAFKLTVKEEQLRLLRDQLETARALLPTLDLDGPKEVPARQEAFLAVADRVAGLRRTAQKVFRDGEVSPPPLDPNTLSEQINSLSGDAEYMSFSVEYRIKFLRAIARAIDDRREAVKQTVARLQNLVRASYSFCEGGAAFPIKPMDFILDAVARDLQEEDISLPADLNTTAIQANLRTYMMAGELDKAFQRLSLYAALLNETTADSLWSRFVHAYNQWQDVRNKARELAQVWGQVTAYFVADPDRGRWLGTALVDRQEEVRERIAAFAGEFERDYPSPRVEDLEAEVASAAQEVALVITEAKQSLENGRQEIANGIAATALPALTKLMVRLGQPAWVSEQLVLGESRHIDQHSKVVELDQRARERGAEVLDDANLFALYVEVFRDLTGGSESDELVRKYGIDRLKALGEHGAIILEQTITIKI